MRRLLSAVGATYDSLEPRHALIGREDGSVLPCGLGPLLLGEDQGEVLATFSRFQVDCMIHGHTHRPAIHSIQYQNANLTRIVLGDWYEQGSVLRWNETGYVLIALRRNEVVG